MSHNNKNTLGYIGAAALASFMVYAMTSAYADLHPRVILEYQLTSPTVQVNYHTRSPAPNQSPNHSAAAFVSLKSEGRGDDLLFKLLYAVESLNGKLRYRPSNKEKSCAKATTACGYHQLMPVALKQIGCTAKHCLADRDDKRKSEVMARKYLAWLAKHYPNQSLVFQYMAYNQGGAGTNNVWNIAQGEKTLGRKQRRRMLNNLPKGCRIKPFKGAVFAQAFIGCWTIKIEQELIKLKGL